MSEYKLTNGGYVLHDLPNMTKVHEKNGNTMYYIIHHLLPNKDMKGKVIILHVQMINKVPSVRIRSQIHDNYEFFTRSCIIEPMTLSDIFLVRQYCESYKLPFGKWVHEALL